MLLLVIPYERMALSFVILLYAARGEKSSGQRKELQKKKHVDFGVRTILAVGLGLIVGLAFKGHHVYVAAATTLVAATEGQLDEAVYNGEAEAPAAEAV